MKKFTILVMIFAFANLLSGQSIYKSEFDYLKSNQQLRPEFPTPGDLRKSMNGDSLLLDSIVLVEDNATKFRKTYYIYDGKANVINCYSTSNHAYNNLQLTKYVFLPNDSISEIHSFSSGISGAPEINSLDQLITYFNAASPESQSKYYYYQSGQFTGKLMYYTISDPFYFTDFYFYDYYNDGSIKQILDKKPLTSGSPSNWYTNYKIRYYYDANINLTKLEYFDKNQAYDTVILSYTTHYNYDSINKLIEIKSMCPPDTNINSVPCKITQYEYDIYGSKSFEKESTGWRSDSNRYDLIFQNYFYNNSFKNPDSTLFEVSVSGQPFQSLSKNIILYNSNQQKIKSLYYNNSNNNSLYYHSFDTLIYNSFGLISNINYFLWDTIQSSYVGLENTKYYYSLHYVGKQENITSLVNITIFPNPFTNQITIRYSDNSSFKAENIRIYNILGEIQKTNCLQLSENECFIDLSYLISGVYFVEIKDHKSGFRSVKILKL